jgi:hypothetical protein
VTNDAHEPLNPDAQLRILSACYDDIAEAQADYDSKAEAAKTAKKALDAATSALLEKVREYTHDPPDPLPLFDEAEREVDQQAMLDAIKSAS